MANAVKKVETLRTDVEIHAAVKTQYRAAFRMMADGSAWHLYRTRPDQFALMRDCAVWDVPHLGIAIHNVHCLTEQMLANKLHRVIREGVSL